MTEAIGVNQPGQPLAVHVLLHERSAGENTQASTFADRLFSRLSRGSDAAGVPVSIWAATGWAEHIDLPPLPDLTTAMRNAVVVLICD